MWRFSNIPGTDSIPKTLEHHILTQLCAQENFIIAGSYAKWRAVKNAEIKLPFLSFLVLLAFGFIFQPLLTCVIKICYSEIIEVSINSN
jgi:hypothetical protein